MTAVLYTKDYIKDKFKTDITFLVKYFMKII